MPNAAVVKPLFRQVQRFPSGVTNQAKGAPKDRMGISDPTTWNVFFEEFYNVTTLTSANNGWAAVGGVGSPVAAPVSDAAINSSGILALTTTNGGTDSTTIARHATLGQNFVLDLTRKLYIEVRFQLVSATEGDFGFGLVPASTTALQGSQTDGIRIGKTSAVATMQADFKVGSTTAAKSVSSLFGGASIAAATWTTLGLAYNGIKIGAGRQLPDNTTSASDTFVFTAYTDLGDGNGPRMQDIAVTAAQLPANTVGLMPSVSFLQTAGTQRINKLDYVLVAQERY